MRQTERGRDWWLLKELQQQQQQQQWKIIHFEKQNNVAPRLLPKTTLNGVAMQECKM